MSRGERHDGDASAPRFYFAPADDGIGNIIPSLHQHVRAQSDNEIERGVLRKEYNGVHRFERGDNVGARSLGAHGPPGSLEATHRCIRVDSHHERIAHGTGGQKEIHMPGMEQIEHAIGEDDRSTRCRAPCGRLVPVEYLPRRRAYAQNVLSACGVNVIRVAYPGSTTGST